MKTLTQVLKDATSIEEVRNAARALRAATIFPAVTSADFGEMYAGNQGVEAALMLIGDIGQHGVNDLVNALIAVNEANETSEETKARIAKLRPRLIAVMAALNMIAVSCATVSDTIKLWSFLSQGNCIDEAWLYQYVGKVTNWVEAPTLSELGLKSLTTFKDDAELEKHMTFTHDFLFTSVGPLDISNWQQHVSLSLRESFHASLVIAGFTTPSDSLTIETLKSFYVL